MSNSLDIDEAPVRANARVWLERMPATKAAELTGVSVTVLKGLAAGARVRQGSLAFAALRFQQVQLPELRAIASVPEYR